MIGNYLKIAIRNFWRHKLFTLINVIGLCIGISAALVIYLVVNFDFTFDDFHKDSDRIYRVTTKYSYQGLPAYNPGVCGPIVGALKNDVAGIDVAAPLFRLTQPDVLIPGPQLTRRKFKLRDNVILTDENYFKIFQYKWLAGSRSTSLNAPFQVVLTSAEAALYFPHLSYDKILGRTLLYDSIKTQVSGVVENIKGNTDLTFQDFISYNTAMAGNALKPQLRLHNWWGTNAKAQLFLKLSRQTTFRQIERQLNAIYKRSYDPGPERKGNTHTFILQPLSDIHFNENYGTFDKGRVADKTTLYELSGIALFLLLLACINFVNLSTAQSAQRAKEIGIRKTMGSNRLQLMIQFLSETLIITMVSVCVSVALVPYILKVFVDIMPAGITLNYIERPGILLFLAGLTIVIGLLSGFYPALILSAYKPLQVLKAQTQSYGTHTRGALLRKSLTVSQFIIAQFFIMATILVSKQIHYALNKNLGFKTSAIVILNSPSKNQQAQLKHVLFNKLQAIPQIKMVSLAGDAPISGDPQGTEGTYTDGKKEIKVEDLVQKFGDENYIALYHIPLLAGRNLRAADTSGAFLINTTLARRIGFIKPQDALGKQIINFNGDRTMTVIGVVADFQQESIHQPIAPLAVLAAGGADESTFHILFKPSARGSDDWGKAIQQIKTSWKQVYPDDSFEMHFLDENIAGLYQSEQHTSTLLNYATGLSIFISCMGLLGLALYTTAQRTKEIGVRKVLGASVLRLIGLLSSELVVLIALAFVLVTPISIWIMNSWMQNFADRTPISWWIFLLSGMGMLCAALVTSGFLTIRAAIANPVKSLRSE